MKRTTQENALLIAIFAKEEYKPYKKKYHFICKGNGYNHVFYGTLTQWINHCNDENHLFITN